MSDLERDAVDLANALNFLAEALVKFEGDIASVPGLAVIVDDLAKRADRLYGHALHAAPPDNASTPTNDNPQLLRPELFAKGGAR
jgi:hypothetical protein